MARVLTTVEAVRARFGALQRDQVFFDAPGGTQVPDSVIDAIADYLRNENANLGGPFETSRLSDALIARAHSTAAGYLNATVDEIVFGANMTTLNFALSRTAARTWHEGDEIVCTQLDHDGNIAPWLELAYDRGFTVNLARVDDECRIDLEHLRSLVNERTRVVAYPFAANSVGTITPVAEIARIAHEAGALAWVDAVHYGPHGPIDVAATEADVLLCSPYKFYGPHMGLAFVKGELDWRPYKVRPADSRHETGTLAHELLAGFVACVEYLDDVGWDFVLEHEHELGQRFLDGLPDGWTLHGVPTMEGRVPTFAITHDAVTPEDAATRLGERGFAVWHGDYYAVEIMKRLGLPDGAVRIGIVHYNTADEVDRLLAALAEIGS
ncbi:MAG: cysteine desulfurase-like protein [Gaiellaceae bacterium]